MVGGFYMGGDWWSVRIVPPSSPFLVERRGRRTVATTDTAAKVVSVSSSLHGPMLRRVLAHEATHCALHSYGVLKRLHRYAPRRHWVALEEEVCNTVADYGDEILSGADTATEAVTLAADNVLRLVG